MGMCLRKADFLMTAEKQGERKRIEWSLNIAFKSTLLMIKLPSTRLHPLKISSHPKSNKLGTNLEHISHGGHSRFKL
jgi:hypothetical protein